MTSAQDHTQYTDEEFLSLFRKCELEEALFSHEAHLRMAWLNVKAFDLAEAIETTRKDILRYVDHLNAKDIYHETVTVAAVKMIHHFYTRSNKRSFKEFIEEFPRTKTNFKELIAAHYSVDIFSSEKAKQVFIEPDLLPF